MGPRRDQFKGGVSGVSCLYYYVLPEMFYLLVVYKNVRTSLYFATDVQLKNWALHTYVIGKIMVAYCLFIFG
jgi:hypothetical protein